MEARQRELAEIKSYIEGIDKEVTMILQSLQWDRKQLLEGVPKVSCSYDAGHRVPSDKKEEHERECSVRSQGYLMEDKLLPEPLDPNADTLVKFYKEDIMQIIDNASKNDPMFKKGAGCADAEPLTLERLQATYTADERRALHDAAVSAAPACHDLADLALTSSANDTKSSKPKSRVEVLAELRDMRRRRAKYRVSGATGNYSHVLRDVIRTQMEVFSITHTTDSTEKTTSQTLSDVNKDPTHRTATTPTQHKHDEKRERLKDNERYTDTESSKRHRKKYDEYTETATKLSRENKNSRGSHTSRYDHNNRYEKQYSRSDKYKSHDDRHNRQYRTDEKYNHWHNSKDKQKRSQSKERNRRDDKHETKIVVKEEFDASDEHSDYYESKRDKYSHKSYYYDEGSSGSRSKSKRSHRDDDYSNDRQRDGREKHRSKDDRKRKRKEDSEEHSETHYKRYYENVVIKQEIDP